MYNCYLVRYHEIALKGKNRPYFEKKLAENIRVCLSRNRVSFSKIQRLRSRIIIYSRSDCSCLKYVFGISSFSPAIETKADMKIIEETALSLYTKGSFRISARRSDKRFKVSSQQINEEVGKFLVQRTGAEVKLKEPEVDIGIEILDEKAYIYNKKIRCLGGMPISTAGKVAVMLDSKNSLAAAYLMLKRGCSIIFVKKKDIDYSILEKFSYGSKIITSKEIPTNVKALIVTDIAKINSYKTNLTILRPLIGLRQSAIDKILEALK